MGEIGGIIGLGSQIAGLVGGGGGGGDGGGSGGLSEQEALLAQYEGKQQLFKSQSDLASTGTVIGTPGTWSAGGSRLFAALKGASISDAAQQVQGKAAQQSAQAQGTAAGSAAAASQLAGNNQGLSGDQGSLGNEDTASLGAA